MPLHPEVRALIAEVADLQRSVLGFRSGHIDRLTPTQVRAWMPVRRRTLGVGPEVYAVEDLTIQTPAIDLTARRYRPSAQASGVWVWFHGGGGVVGSVDDQDEICKLMAVATGLEVLSVDYRLAPEYPFPAAVDDAEGAVAWTGDHLAAGRPIVVGGESAGGMLATVAARRLAARGEPQIAVQVLVHPMTDVDLDTDSYRTYGGGEYLLSRDLMRWFWGHYLANPADLRHPDAVPLRTPQLSGQPPAIVVLAGLDPLRDEGAAYAERLRAAGVPTHLEVYDDVIHGFWVWAPRLSRGADAVADAARLIHQYID